MTRNENRVCPLNNHLSLLVMTAAEIERFSAMFQEKKQEVQTAILRVDQLSQQLEDLKKGKLNGFQSYNGRLTGPAAVELKRLYQELQVRARVWDG